jgi:hypothetical protein
MKITHNELHLLDWYKQFYPLTEWQMEEKPNQAVYVFYNPRTHLYKIGISEDVERRCSAISSQSGCKIQHVISLYTETSYNIDGKHTVVSSCDESVKFIESKLHLYFKDRRRTGEWFDLSVRHLIAIRLLFWEVIVGWDVQDDIKEHIKIVYNENTVNNRHINVLTV